MSVSQIPTPRAISPKTPPRSWKLTKRKKKILGLASSNVTFTPFVVSTDGLIGKEAKTLLKKLSTLLADKGKSY
jgi:hypothetical protein